MPATVSRLLVLVLASTVVYGCGKDENSPDMGAVPPKPNPNMNANLPPQVREQMKGAEQGMAAQAAEMGAKSKFNKK